MRIRLVNVVVPSRHFTESVVFYRDTLGLPVTFENETCCFVQAGGAQIALHPVAEDSPFLPTGHGFYLDMIVDDMETVKARLTAAGCAPLREWTDPGGTPFLLVADPDGNRIEIYTETGSA